MLSTWLCGSAGIGSFWWRAWRRVRSMLGSAVPHDLGIGVEVRYSPQAIEPGVVGVLRPVLLLPEGITERLTRQQMQAVLAHELCHIRRRDNLAAVLHMIVEAAFWFHPLVWWIGARLVEERERACDEEVLLQGNRPSDYAEGILNVCKLYLESPLACVSGITGADLTSRISRIMLPGPSPVLDAARKALLAVSAIAAVLTPLVIGAVSAPRLRAQEKLSFEVASVKPSDPSERFVRFAPVKNGRFEGTGFPLKLLITEAYHVQDFQVFGGPSWQTTDRFDVKAKGNDKATQAEVLRMVQTLLADRFGLVIHRETREMPLYAIVVAKGGPKMQVADKGPCGESTRDHPCGGFNMQNRRHLWGERVSVQQLGDMLAFLVKRVVQDKTGLADLYNMKLDWVPDESQALSPEQPENAGREPEGASLYSAMQEQLGLKLESRRGPVEVLVVDKAEKPKGN